MHLGFVMAIVGARFGAAGEEQQPTIRVVVVDDHEMVRSGLKTVIARADDIEVVGEAATARSGVDEVVRLRPDVVLMDIRLGDGSGIDAAREITESSPQTAVVMLTAMEEDGTVFASILAGASGYLLKNISPRDLVSAIRTVAGGDSLLDSAVTATVLESVRRNSELHQDEKLGRLSAQERRILVLIAEGKTNREIADEVHLAYKTVKNYVSSILTKLEVQRRSEAAAYFSRRTVTPGS